MSIYKHKHHIIPRHMGGSDDPSNIVELTIEEHAEAHRLLYEEHGRWQDKLAWLGLSGQIGKEEIIRMKNSEAHKGQEPWNKGKTGCQTHTDETRRKMRESAKKRPPQSRESIEKTRQANIGKTLSDETRRKISEGNKGKVISEDHRRILSETHKGKVLCEDHKRKISEAKKGKPRSEETKRKISESKKGKKGKPRSEETKRKISESVKKRAAERRAAKND